MSEATITVSDGEDFFRIPVSDLEEAVADGFYVPAFNDRTIVSDGEDMFEIPLEDLAEAQEDGFRDALLSEQDAIAEARSILGIGEPTAAESPAAAAPAAPQPAAPAPAAETGGDPASHPGAVSGRACVPKMFLANC